MHPSQGKRARDLEAGTRAIWLSVSVPRLFSLGQVKTVVICWSVVLVVSLPVPGSGPFWGVWVNHHQETDHGTRTSYFLSPSPRTTWCLSCPFLWVFGSSFSVMLTVSCCSTPRRFLPASSLCLISPTRCVAYGALRPPSPAFSLRMFLVVGLPLWTAACCQFPGTASASALTTLSAFAIPGGMECFAGPPHAVSVGTPCLPPGPISCFCPGQFLAACNSYSLGGCEFPGRDQFAYEACILVIALS